MAEVLGAWWVRFCRDIVLNATILGHRLICLAVTAIYILSMDEVVGARL